MTEETAKSVKDAGATRIMSRHDIFQNPDVVGDAIEASKSV